MEPLDVVSKVISGWIADATSRNPKVRAEAWQDIMIASTSPNSSIVLNLAARQLGSTPKQVLQAMAKTARDKAGVRTGVKR